MALHGVVQSLLAYILVCMYGLLNHKIWLKCLKLIFALLVLCFTLVRDTTQMFADDFNGFKNTTKCDISVD